MPKQKLPHKKKYSTKIEDRLFFLQPDWFKLRIKDILELLHITIKHYKIKSKNVKKDIIANYNEFDIDFDHPPNDDIPLDIYFDELADIKKHKLLKVFPDLLLEALFITAYSYFEKELDDVCGSLKERCSFSLSLSDLNGKGVFRSLLYLKKIARLNIDSKIVNRISIYNKIRNCIVHNNGVLQENDKNLLAELSKLPNIDTNKSKGLKLTAMFLEETIEDYIEFVALIFSEIKEIVPSKITSHSITQS